MTASTSRTTLMVSVDVDDYDGKRVLRVSVDELCAYHGPATEKGLAAASEAVGDAILRRAEVQR